MPDDTITLPEVHVTPADNQINYGGVADAWDPHGNAPSLSDFVISGLQFNQGIADASVLGQGQRAYAGSAQAYQDALNAAGNPPVPFLFAAIAPYLGPQGFAQFVASYDNEQRIHAAIGTPGFGADEPPTFHQSGPPEVYPFLKPAPDTREASSGIGSILAAISEAVVGPAEAGGLDPSRVPYLLQPEGTGGGGGVGRGGPAGMEQNIPDIEIGLEHANLPAAPRAARNWLASHYQDIRNDHEYFYGADDDIGNIDASVRFFEENMRIGTRTGAPLFPVYEQIFGPGTPPLFMGYQALSLDPAEFGGLLPIFKWGNVVPPKY